MKAVRKKMVGNTEVEDHYAFHHIDQAGYLCVFNESDLHFHQMFNFPLLSWGREGSEGKQWEKTRSTPSASLPAGNDNQRCSQKCIVFIITIKSNMN